MRMKSFAMLAMSGLLAASLVYVAPAVADDNTSGNTGATQAAPADNSTQNQNNATSGNIGSDNSGMSGTQSPSDNNSNSSGSSSDEGSPDQATGDDDY